MTATRRPATTEEEQLALALRLAGNTYAEIAARLGYRGPSSIYTVIRRAIGDDPDLRKAIGGRRARSGVAYDRGDGYKRVSARGHPLAGRDGRVLEHRLVLYDRLGPGPHPCARCGRSLEWRQLDVDHVNADPSDNRPENLQPCCAKCNRITLVRWRAGRDYPEWMDDPDCPEDFDGLEAA